MSEIILFNGFKVPASEGPFAMPLKVWPASALPKILKAYKYRSSPGWQDNTDYPEKAAQRIKTIQRKLVLHHARKRPDTRSAECKEGIRTGSQERRG